MRVIGYYTKDEIYEPAADKLRASLDKFGIKYDIVGYATLGTWAEATAFKPTFIYDMLLKYPHETLVYMDADAAVIREPVQFYNHHYGLAAHYKDGRELLSGTLLFGYVDRDAILKLVRAWIAEQTRNPMRWDQKNLQTVIARSDLKVVNLPAGYAKIFDMMPGVEPIVEHYQASRLKKKEEKIKMQITETRDGILYVYGYPLRRAEDGSHWLARENAPVIAYMDQHYKRCASELRWENKPAYASVSILSGLHLGSTFNIVGKGPSLDSLSAADLGGRPTIAINEAIHSVEKLQSHDVYGIQQDTGLKETCWPAHGTLLLAKRCANWYTNLRNKCVYVPEDYGLRPTSISVAVALHLAKLMGARDCKLFAFDGCTNKDTAYARSVGYESTKGGKPERFLSHRPRIELTASELRLPITFVTEVDIFEPASCNTLPLLQHPQAHDEPESSEHLEGYTETTDFALGTEAVQPENQSSH